MKWLEALEAHKALNFAKISHSSACIVYFVSSYKLVNSDIIATVKEFDIVKCLWAVWVLLVCLVFTVGANGTEIYRCKDDRGNPVFSQTPCPNETIKGDSAAHRLWREMRGMVLEAIEINKRLGPTLVSIKQCHRDVVQLNAKLEGINDRVQKIAFDNVHLKKAFDFLLDCAQCRSSASRACVTADKHLNQAMNRL